MNQRKVIAIVLGLVFLQYFVGTTFFVHCHELPTRVIVHSHPFANKPHNHSDSQVLCLDLLSQATCVTSPQLSAPNFFIDIIHIVGGVCLIANEQVPIIGVCQLRAPPVC